MVDEARLIRVKNQHLQWLQTKADNGFRGVAVVSQPQPCLVVFTSEMPEDVKAEIQTRLGQPLRFEESGDFSPP